MKTRGVAAAIGAVVAGAVAFVLFRQMSGSPPISAVPGLSRLEWTFPLPRDGSVLPVGWELTTSKGEAKVKVNPSGNERSASLWVRAEVASFLLANRTQTFDPSDFPWLAWEWKGVVLPTGGDVRLNSLVFGTNRNDQVLQVLVAFENKNVLSYIWDTTAPVGTEVREPSIVGRVESKVVQSGSPQLGTWVKHRVNIFEDYRRRFGAPPPRVVGIIVQTNSNHTSSISEGEFGAIAAIRE